MPVERESWKETATWELIEHPNVNFLMPGKLVFKVKSNQMEGLKKKKARYMAKRFKQMEGIDYGEPLAPMTKLEAFGSVLLLAAKKYQHRTNGYWVSFLHPLFKDEICNKQSQGFKKLVTRKSVFCRLNKSIEGLKQAAKNWHKKSTLLLIKSKNTKDCWWT